MQAGLGRLFSEGDPHSMDFSLAAFANISIDARQVRDRHLTAGTIHEYIHAYTYSMDFFLAVFANISIDARQVRDRHLTVKNTHKYIHTYIHILSGSICECQYIYRCTPGTCFPPHCENGEP